MNYDYLVLVVLYNRSIHQSETITSLVNQRDELKNSKVIIWDNSSKPIPQEELQFLSDSFDTSSYFHTPENLPLAKIYNHVIAQSQDSNFIILFDQDSSFDRRYLDGISAGRKAFPEINLLVPLILHEKKIMSPGYYFIFKGIYRKSITLGKLSSRNMTIIMSGMAVSAKYINENQVKFNEKLTFYGLDTFFACQYRNDNKFFYVFDCGFKHDISLYANEDYAIKVKRFKNYRQSLSILAKRSWIIYLLHFPYIIYMSIIFYVRNKLLN